jgi:hypothetical protein
MSALVRVSEIIVPEWDPLDADPGLVVAVARVEDEQREIELVNGLFTETMCWALLTDKAET